MSGGVFGQIKWVSPCHSLLKSLSMYQDRKISHHVHYMNVRGTSIFASASTIFHLCSSFHSHHDEHRSSCPRPVKLYSDQYIFQFLFRTIYTYMYMYKNKFKNLIGPVNSNVYFEEWFRINFHYTCLQSLVSTNGHK